MLTKIALVAFGLGPLLAHLHVVAPLIGFVLFAIGAIGGLIAGIGALISMFRGRSLAAPQWLATAVALWFVGTLARGAGNPRINDFTTDPSDPPAFRHAQSLPANVGRDLSYPAAFAPQQQACCADLQPGRTPGPVAAAFTRARATAAAMPTWTVTNEDAASGTIEAVATSWLFQFEDDIAIRVKPGDDLKVRVDVRSKSRDGQGDFGVNANRIRAFVAALDAAH